MEVELKALQERVGITFVCVTHDQEEALTMSDRLAVMDHGRLLQVGTPEEIYTAPASAFVASFIGVSNSLPGRVQAIEGQRATVAVEGIGLVHALACTGLRAGTPVLVTIRPERLPLPRHPATDGYQNQIAVRVRSEERR